MAILQLDVRPRKGERRNRRAQWRAATGPSVELSLNDMIFQPYLDSHSDSAQAEMPEEAPLWQEVVWKLSSDAGVGLAVNAATQRLEDVNISTARLDAQVILAHVLGVERSWLFAHYEHVLSPEQAERYMDMIVRRVAHEPVAYLVNRREFYGINLYVDARVLIPRPETEMLVDEVLTEATIRAPRRMVVADVGTGSGAIAIAVAANAPNAHVYALDLSADALEVARRNVEAHDLGERITLLQSDLLANLPEPVDVLVANLPYVTSGDYETLEPDVRNYEPAVALVAGPLGLDAIFRLLEQAPAKVLPGGVVVLEIGYNQGEQALTLVETVLPQATQLELHRDYQGRDRVVSFQL